MSDWTEDELQRVSDAEELELASPTADGPLRSFTTMWVVRVGRDLFVRSAGGPNRPWYRQARANGEGRIRAYGIEADVSFSDGAVGDASAIDAAYHAKYDRYGPNIVGHVTGPTAEAVTLRLVKSAP